MCQGYNCEQDQLLAPVKLTSYLGSQKINKQIERRGWWPLSPSSKLAMLHVSDPPSTDTSSSEYSWDRFSALKDLCSWISPT